MQNYFSKTAPKNNNKICWIFQTSLLFGILKNKKEGEKIVICPAMGMCKGMSWGGWRPQSKRYPKKSSAVGVLPHTWGGAQRVAID